MSIYKRRSKKKAQGISGLQEPDRMCQPRYSVVKEQTTWLGTRASWLGEKKNVPPYIGANVHDPCENGTPTTRDFLR